MGLERVVTYTLASESGASLRGSGWRVVAARRAKDPAGWGRTSRLRRLEPSGSRESKLLWEAV